MKTSNSAIKAEPLVDLIQKELPEDPVWIGPAILPKNCKLIFGAPASTGKSFVLLSLARSLALGEHNPLSCPLFNIDRPVRTLLIEHELKPYGLQQRVKKIFQDDDLKCLENNLWYVSGEPSVQFSSEEGYHTLVRLVDEIKPEVLILDPIGKMHYYDENDNSGIAKLMYKIDLLIRQGFDWGMSVMFSHHYGKPPEDIRASGGRDKLDPYNFRGAAKWKDDPDVKVTMQRLETLRTPHESWRIKTRWLTRQGGQLPDIYFKVNENNDMRVIFDRIEAQRTGMRPLVPPDNSTSPQHHDAPVKSNIITFDRG